jgi:hypothetical protein
MGQGYEEAMGILRSSGKPGKLVRLDDDSWDVLPLPDKDPVIDKRKQEAQLAKAQKEAMRIRLEEEQARRNEAHREHLKQMEIEQQAKREHEERILSLRKEREAERLRQHEALRNKQLQQASKNLMHSSRHSNKHDSATKALFNNDGFSSSYRAAIETSLRRFVANGNDVACTGVYIYEYGNCGLCGHQPIKWHYILENLSSRNQIVVGSECIRNYKIILEEWGYRPAYVVFPECLRKFTGWILEEDSGAIKFSDAVACFYTKNPRELYGVMQTDQKLQMFTFAKKIQGMLVASDAMREAHEVSF